ncbi:MAG: hypothetical protein JO328_16010 [Hyphomicrobiales bacterium]|nr:hypothetical protein [Hyphomicrobiales bacterium]MBV8826908.1 hypothetical protein [Hyphomicrobiales bacterium]MBV9429265.1 hypothetical protein [Bradyrhizobiaceae bacterium]
MILLWVLCLPVAAVMLAAAIERAFVTKVERRPINHVPALVLPFDVRRARRSSGSHGYARECAQVIMLHEPRRR